MGPVGTLCRVIWSAKNPRSPIGPHTSALTIDILLGASKVNGLDTTDLLLGKGGLGRRDGASTHQAPGSDEGALLDARSGKLAAQLGAQALGEAFRGHCEGMGCEVRGLGGER